MTSTLLFGPYRTPSFSYGDIVHDEVRGDVTIVGLTDARIPWPIGKGTRAKTLVVYDALAAAVRNESNCAVCHWWGVTPQTVTKWRKALGVSAVTPGTSALRASQMTPEQKSKMQAALAPKQRDSGRIEKIRRAKTGTPRPRHVIETLRQANLGTHWCEETRQRHLARRKRRYPKDYEPWTPQEDEWVQTLSVRKAVERTGRTRTCVERRRKSLRTGSG